LDKAVEYYQKALKLMEDLGSKEGMANAYGNLGNVYQLKGDKTEAKRYYQMSLNLFKQIGSPNEKKVQTWLDAVQ
jgi:protein O-GlcNAc transferase